MQLNTSVNLEKTKDYIEALDIIEKLKLIDLLNSYGRVEIVGSVAADLILDRDIDIHILTDYNIHEISEITIGFIKTYHNISEIKVESYEDKESICVTIVNYNNWNIEIWISNNINYVGFELKKELEKLLTDEKRKIIMCLKRHYYALNLLHGEMSTNIYKAVIYYNINSIDSFEEYISNQDR